MADEKKTIQTEETEMQELNLDDLEQVSGGSLRNAPKVEPTPISDNTKHQI